MNEEKRRMIRMKENGYNSVEKGELGNSKIKG